MRPVDLHSAPATAYVQQCSERLEAIAESLFSTIERLAATFIDSYAASTAGGKPFTTAHLAPLQDAIFEALDDSPIMDGVGLAMKPSTLADRDRYFEWWNRANDGYEPVPFNLDPATCDFYDYLSREWFSTTVDERRRYAGRPAIGMPCSETLIMTMTVPLITADGCVLGVAVGDMAISRLESKLIAVLRRIPVDAVLVNDDRRVIASNGARWTTGEKLQTQPAVGSDWRVVVPVTADLGWSLAVGNEARSARYVTSSRPESR